MCVAVSSLLSSTGVVAVAVYAAPALEELAASVGRRDAHLLWGCLS